MKLVNLTPHEINIEGTETLPPSGVVARVEERSQSRGYLDEDYCVQIVAKSYGDIINLPSPVEGTIYVTSAIVAQVAWKKRRWDVFCPGDPLRDEEGHIVGCRALCTAAVGSAPGALPHGFWGFTPGRCEWCGFEGAFPAGRWSCPNCGGS